MKKKKSKNEPDTPEEVPKLQGDEFEKLQHVEMPKAKATAGGGKRKKDSPLRQKIEKALDMLLQKRAEEKEEATTDALRMMDLFHEIWMGVSAESLFLTHDEEKCKKAAHIALQLRTCVALMCDPMVVRESDDILRANIDMLLDEIKEHPYALNPTVKGAIRKLRKIDIPLALMNHRKELTGEEVEMKLAIVDLATGEIFWSSRYKVNGGQDMKGFLPIAPFYVGCTNYQMKVELFAKTVTHSGTPLMIGAVEENREIMKRCLKHLIISFRLGSIISPHIIERGEDGEEVIVE